MGMCKKCNKVSNFLEMSNGLCKECMSEEELEAFQKNKPINVKEEKKKINRIIDEKFLGIFLLLIIITSTINYFIQEKYPEVAELFITLLFYLIGGVLYTGFMALISLIKKINTANKIWLISSSIFIICIILLYISTEGTKEDISVVVLIFAPFIVLPKLTFIVKDYLNKNIEKKNNTIINEKFLGIFLLLIIITSTINFFVQDNYLEISELFSVLLTYLIIGMLYTGLMAIIGHLKKVNTPNQIWLISSSIFIIFAIIFYSLYGWENEDIFEIVLNITPFIILPKLTFIFNTYLNRNAIKKKSDKIIDKKFLGFFLLLITITIIIGSIFIDIDIDELFFMLLFYLISGILYTGFMALIGLIKKVNTPNKIWLISSSIFIISIILFCILNECELNKLESEDILQIVSIIAPFIILPKLTFIFIDYLNNKK